MKPWRAISDGRAGARQAGPLVLDLSETAVVLWYRKPDGTLEEVGQAPLESDDFAGQIDALRVEALVRDAARRPVTLWLPQSQILERSYVLGSQRHGAAHAEAARLLQAETEYSSTELSIDLIPAKAGSPTIVLAALCQTIREAREYASRWGFNPGPVSTRYYSEPFGERAPVFELPKTRAHVAGRRFVHAGVAAVIALSAGYAGLHLYDASQPLLRALTIAEVPGQSARPLVNKDKSPELHRASVAVSRSVWVQTLQIRSVEIADLDALSSARDTGYAVAFLADAPTELDVPAEETALRIGPESLVPGRSRPGRLGAPARATERFRVASLRHAVDRIRLNSRVLAKVPDQNGPRFKHVAEALIAVAAAPEANAAQQNVPLAAVAPSISVAVQSEVEPTVESTAAAEVLAPKSEAEVDATGREEEQVFAAIDPAIVTPPKPRPLREEPSEPAEASDAGETEAQTAPAAPVEAETVAPPDEAREAEVEATAPIAEVKPEPDPEERLAALTSPNPVKRPQRLEAAEPKLSKRKKPVIASKPSPSSIRSAANERGLVLDETSLIGVIDANSGRRALVRLPDGDFRKVSRGDVLEGWRVSSITREAMRLTRQGQNRTLLLVSR